MGDLNPGGSRIDDPVAKQFADKDTPGIDISTNKMEKNLQTLRQGEITNDCHLPNKRSCLISPSRMGQVLTKM